MYAFDNAGLVRLLVRMCNFLQGSKKETKCVRAQLDLRVTLHTMPNQFLD